MSSSEISAEIAELRAALGELKGQVSQVIAKYRNAASTLSSINASISGSQDTLIVKAISSTNSVVLGKITGLIGSIQGELSSVESQVNSKIQELERLLEIALAQEARERNKGKISLM